jgi:hypothetical protein
MITWIKKHGTIKHVSHSLILLHNHWQGAPTKAITEAWGDFHCTAQMGMYFPRFQMGLLIIVGLQMESPTSLNFS